MKTYRFHEGPVPEQTTPQFEPALFNLTDFRQMQDPQHWQSFYVVHGKTGRVAAWWHLHRDGDAVRSPFKAPFGSIECDEHIPPSVLFDFLGFAELRLRDMGVSEVYITNPPRVYAPEYLSLLETFLLNQGYEVADAETGTALLIDERSFLKRVRQSEMLRYRQARRAGLSCRLIQEDSIGEVYKFIARCHAEKGYSLSISNEMLVRSVRTFPGRYVLFGVFEENEIRAASVSIRVKNHILYNFLVNHDPKYNSLSPPILLMESLYNYCYDNGITLLDLGTSALDGRPNFRLLDFKLHMGGTPTTKLSFYKKIV